MKKSYFLSGILMLAVVTALLVACQKDQSGVTEATTGNGETVTATLVGSKDVNGYIKSTVADDMRDEFLKKYGKSQTQYVAFSAKDLAGYLNTLQTKYKSDSIYINFGVYDSKTATSKSNVGKLTVFFMGKNKVAKNGNVRSDDDNDPPPPGAPDPSNYLNHGSLFP